MSPFRLIPLCAVLAAPVGLASPAQALPVPTTQTVHRHHHHHHLHQALKDLQVAHAATKANNGVLANQALAAAVRHLDQAIYHHKQYEVTLTQTGLTGFVVTGVHQNHHTHMHKAVTQARAAHKQIVAGHAKKALNDVGGAEHQTKLAIANHPTW
jgi:hypothetical protein